MSADSIGRSAWRSASALFRRDRVVLHNLIVGGGTIAAGALGVAFQSLVSHQLRPPDYGAVFAVITLLTFIGLPGSALTLLMARETSRDRAAGQFARSSALLHAGNRALMLTGLAGAALFALVSPLLARFFDLPLPLLLAATVGMPFGLVLPLLLGEFQGQQRFVAYSLLATGQAALKLAAALALGLLYGPFGIVAGISLATAAVYLVALWMLRRKLSIKPRLPWWRPAAAYLAVILPSTVSLAVLLSADVLLVKHFFPGQAAGEYAAVAAMGRAIFWGAAGVAGVLFPKVIFHESQGRSGTPLVSASLFLVALGGLFGLGLLSFGSRWLLTAFAGPAYAGAAAYVPWYAVGMTLLGGAAVIIATQQSRGQPGFLAVLVPLALLEPVLLVMFHQNLMQVVQVLDVSMALILAGVGAQFVIQENALRAGDARPVSTSVATAPGISPPQVSR